MKKVKGFTLVELIVVMAIFGMIMAAALSIINPVGELYQNTSSYETARSSSSNVRQYIEENIQYADRFAAVIGSDAYPAGLVSEFTDYFGKYVGSGTDTPVYVMHIHNDINQCSGTTSGNLNVINNAKGKISIYKDNVIASEFAVNPNVYADYGFDINLSSTFSSSDLSANIDIYPVNKKSRVDTGTGFTFDYSTKDDGTAPYSTTATFSMINAVKKQEKIFYYQDIRVAPPKLISESEVQSDWVQEHWDEATDSMVGDYRIQEIDVNRIVDNSTTSGSFTGGLANLGGATKDIYFIYTLPKHANEY